MKIRKFNESLDSTASEYIEECFIDFIDSGAKLNKSRVFIKKINKEVNYCSILLKNLDISFGKEYTNDECNNAFDAIDNLSKIVDDSRVCIEKVRHRYNKDVLDIMVTFLTTGSIQIIFIDKE